MLDSFSISLSPGWQWFMGTAVLLGALAMWWTYRDVRRWNPALVGAFILKLLGILLILFILLEPVSIRKKAVPGVNQLAVLLDTSQTMTVNDPETALPRSQILTNWFSNDGLEWIEDLSRTYKVRFYSVDSRMKSVTDPRDIRFDGDSSALNSALDRLGKAYADKPLAGVVLMTDGIPTDSMTAGAAMENLPPVFVVPVGGTGATNDARMDRISIRESTFEDAPVEAELDVHVEGYRGHQVTVKIVDTDGTAVFSESDIATSGDFTRTFRASWKPGRKGIRFYRAVVEIGSNSGNPNDQPPPEVTELNNSRWISVDHGQDPHRILYVSGRPNWEFKFLNRALSEDPLLDLVGLIRIAKREPKFQFKGRTGETSNPLFRGFDKQDEETEQYDQPVIKRINVRDARELSDGFPTTEEELFRYDAIILDDLESEFFSRTQHNLIREFVSRRGGGLLMLGGMESFAEGNYQDTPLKDVIPVYLNNVPETSLPNRNIEINLTDEGWLEQWVRLRSTEAAEIDRRNEMAPYQAANITGRQKPGASVIAVTRDNRGEMVPVIISQRYGRGKSVCMTLTDFWRPGMRSPEAMADVKKAWRQMVRFLVTDVPEKLDLTLGRTQDDPHEVMVDTLVLNGEFYPEDNARVSLKVTPPQVPSPDSSLAAEWTFESLPSARKSGVLESSFSARIPGPYRVTAMAQDENGIPIGEVSAGWVANPLAEEFSRLVPDRDWMNQLASITGGEVLSMEDLLRLEERLKKLDLPEMRSEPWPLWHQPWILALALLLLLGEWGIRRVQGMP